jgi:hypothetical protein
MPSKNSCHKTSACGVCPIERWGVRASTEAIISFKEMPQMRRTILASVVLTGVALCAAWVSAQADDSSYSLVCKRRGTGSSSTEEAKRAEVLVLGVYHMANPGHDIFNMQADDVLAPKR